MAGAPNGYPNGFSAPNVGYGNGDPSLSLSPELLDDRYQARPGSIRPSIDPHANSFGRFHEPNPAVQYNPHPSSRTSMRTGPNYGYSNSLSRQNGVHGTLVTPFSQLSTRSNQSYSQHSSNGEQHSQYTTPYSQHREPYQQYSAQPQLITRPTNHPHRSDATQEYHAPLGHRTYSPAITTPIRNQPRPQPSYQNVNIQIKATADEASYDGFNIGQVKQLFNDWKARPYASLNIEGDTVKLIYPNP
ncbi:MAG: hypothetical protein HAW66_05150, partial [Shewanella sp.]|nr:hypothetical protein [Shewanella sp.]